jgi:hypothetical protein
MRIGALVFAGLGLVALDASASDTKAEKAIPDDCPVTLSTEPPFVPPAPYDPTFAGGFWHGSKALAVYLPADGRLATHGNRRKMIWYRENYHWTDDRLWSRLLISGHRLDSSSNAKPYADHATNASLAKGVTVLMHIVVIPEPGCWQLEGNYDGDYVSFVAWVD